MLMNLPQKLMLTGPHVCPWWLAYAFDNPVRRLFHRSEKIFSPYLKPGMTAMDVGCGMGFFSIGMARMVGNSGKVISVDIQQKMLDILRMRALEAGVGHRVQPHCATPDGIGLSHHSGRIDLALTFWMVHETPNIEKFVAEIFSLLIPGGKYLLAEPKGHVSPALFQRITAAAVQAGFKVLNHPHIALSHAVWFQK
jgi:ubiquinone/menaquinone biosynthesis C-methylase UbiE